MGRGRVGVAVGTALLAAAHVAAAQPDPQSLTVLVVNSARVRPEVVRCAEADATAVFGAAGVGVAFVHETDTAMGSRHIDVTVVLASGAGTTIIAKGVDERALGFAALEEKREGWRGRMAWIFFDRVERQADKHHIQSSRLCGLVMAHEIGHMLLPAGHTERGLMQATWGLRSGLLDYFTAAQGDQIHARLALASELARR